MRSLLLAMVMRFDPQVVLSQAETNGTLTLVNLGGDGGVSLDDGSQDTTNGLDAEGGRSNIEVCSVWRTSEK